MAAFRYYINRMITLPLTEKGKDTEWTIIQNLAKTKRFPNIKNHQIENPTDKTTT